jgi:hypothetical protein
MSYESLSSLIVPDRVEAFMRDTWGREARQYRGTLGEAAGALLSSDSFELMLATLNRAHEGWLHLARGGLKRIPQEMVDADGMLDLRKVRAVFAAGETLYLTKAERLSRPLMALCRAIEIDLATQGVDLRHAPSCHVFLTPPGAQGFPVHTDEHGSFILQLEGEKEWVIYEPTANWPPAHVIPRPGGVDRTSLENFTGHVYHLAAGDVLYMPEWWPHEARTSVAHSLHVTLRLFPLRWADVLSDLSTSHPYLQRLVPRGVAAEPESAAEALSDLLASMPFRQDLPGLLDQARRRRAIARPALPNGRIRQVIDADQIDLDTELERSVDQTCVVFGENDEVCIGYPGGVIHGPPEIRPVFDYVSAATAFRPRDLPPIEDGEYDRVEVARYLVREGLVRSARRR